MYLKELEISGFKSFAKKSTLRFDSPISAIVGPNGSGKSNIAEAFRFVLGEQSFKSMRGKKGEDLIFSGMESAGRQNRAAVKVTFDNTDKALDVDFDSVSLERVVHRDGVNEYFINGSQVRLKDIIELLAGGNIGSSGHHIISQGEADRILNTNPKERKAILEDALGLRIFQYKKTESEKKLKKTEENISQVQSLRKEIAPHIKFLQKQVEKIEAGKKLKQDLLGIYQEYLKRESSYLELKTKELSHVVDEPKKRLSVIEDEIKNLEEVSRQNSESTGENEFSSQIKVLENKFYETGLRKETLLKDQGRLEGEVSSLNKILERSKVEETKAVSIERSEINSLKNKISEFKNQIQNEGDINKVREIFSNVFSLVENLFKNSESESNNADEINSEIRTLQDSGNKIQAELSELVTKESDIKLEIEKLRLKLEEDKSSSLDAERKIINLMAEKNQIQQVISKYAVEQDSLVRDESAFKQELTEAAVLVGREVLNYEGVEISIEDEDRHKQMDRKKSLERNKIKVEEFGGGSSEEIMQEFDEVSERDSFLIKEIEDLEKSSASLEEMISELEEKINIKFHEGVTKINKEFQTYFELMFGGGSAGIKIVKSKPKRRKDTDLVSELNMEEDEEEETEEGVDISVNLPRKKIKGLMMLSGGERALTSIALIFAMSQVNPPPFIILDETDAALDEANSKKYSDMIENLSKESQLILITHNRETMSRAGVIYGVTMQTGMSQLLSISFDKGIEWAK